ncbi:MAG TPA: hypothetical protein VIV12_25760, partial [Streptosporangiaceae bacterium]
RWVSAGGDPVGVSGRGPGGCQREGTRWVSGRVVGLPWSPPAHGKSREQDEHSCGQQSKASDLAPDEP